MANRKGIIHTQESLPQGSKIWHGFRNKGIGSSEIATILDLNPYENIEDLWLTKIGIKQPKDLSNNYAVKRGTALEPIARNITNELLGRRFDVATFEHFEFKEFRYSSDGYDRDANEIIEIKCMGPKNHLKVTETKQIIDYYVPQCQWGLMVSGAEKGYFVSYNPEFEKNIIIVEFSPDKEMFKEMIFKASAFWECVQNRINPVTGEMALDETV